MRHADDVYLWPTSNVPKLFEKTNQTLTGIRAVMITKGHQEGLGDIVLEKILAAGLTPEAVKQVLLAQPLVDVKTI